MWAACGLTSSIIREVLFMRIAIFGDICPTKDYRALFNNTPESLFHDVLSIINESDFTICNFECPATNREHPIVKAGPNLKALPKDLDLLKAAGIDIISLANNHILDYGEEGVVDTISKAKAIDMLYFGGGLNIQEAKEPLIIQKNGIKVGLISFAEHEFNIATETTPGANLFDPYASLKDISMLKDKCDFIIVLYHGGIEEYKYPSPLLQKKCRAIVEAGANVVLCQHSHCIGTTEEYMGATIVYGQGNSVFGYRDNQAFWNEGLLVEVDTDSNKVAFVLMKATKKGIYLDKDDTRLNIFYNDSNGLTDYGFLKKSFSDFCRKRASLDLPLFFGKNRFLIKLNRIFKGLVFRPSKHTLMVTHNLIRCEAWNEVIQETLTNEYKR